MSLTFDLTEYPRYQTDLHYRLFNSAWAEFFASGAQAQTPLATFINLYENNPAGTAFLARARDGEEWVGAVSAIPFRVRERGGDGFLAYQISDIMVSPAYRGRQIFFRLLQMLSRRLAEIPRVVIFVFPNRRSRPGCHACGYRLVRTLPSRFIFPSPLAWAFSRSRKAGGICREITLKEAGEKVERSPAAGAGFVRDRAYVSWRYHQPDDGKRFRFHHLLEPCRQEEHVSITTEHGFRGKRFLVLLELYDLTGSPPGREVLSALARLGQERGCLSIFANMTVAKTRLPSPVWGVNLPDAVNPRPVHLLVLPRSGNAALENTFSRLEFATAEWLGFL